MFGTDGSFGKYLLLAGGAVVALGALALLLEKLGLSLGKLPGDLRVEGERGGFYFPIVTCIILSVVVSLLLNLFGKK